MSVHKVFVYGTLMKGDRNAHLLSQQSFLGSTKTLHAHYTMIEKPSWSVPGALTPGVLDGGLSHIIGECYEVDQPTFEMLDELEELNTKYKRECIELSDFSVAWIYILIEKGEIIPENKTARVVFNATDNTYKWTIS